MFRRVGFIQKTLVSSIAALIAALFCVSVMNVNVIASAAPENNNGNNVNLSNENVNTNEYSNVSDENVTTDLIDTDTPPTNANVTYNESSKKEELQTISEEAEKTASTQYKDVESAITTQLLANSGITQEELDKLKSEIKSREDELKRLNAELDELKDQLKTRENEIKGLEKLVKYSEAHVLSLNIKKDMVNGNIEAVKKLLGYYASEEYKIRNHATTQMCDLIFGGKTLQELVAALNYWDSIEDNIASNISKLNRDKQEVEEIEEQIAIHNEIIEQSKKDLEVANSYLNKTKEQYAAQMAQSQSDLLLLRGQALLQQEDYLRQIYGSDIIAVGTMSESEAKLRTAIVKTALSCLGADYVWGGESWEEGGFDCSGLCQYSYAQNGISIMRVAVDQYNSNPKIRKEDLRPGDLIFFGSSSSNIHHVVMYIGDGLTIEAPQTGDVVKIRPLEGRSEIYGYASPLAAYYFGSN